jgi:hypothetical protein
MQLFVGSRIDAKQTEHMHYETVLPLLHESYGRKY